MMDNNLRIYLLIFSEVCLYTCEQKLSHYDNESIFRRCNHDSQGTP
jgi:hypothetical protein